ncbi:MAG TPA: DNA adenine methylase [Planctomycetota bacterium]|nr:DNA adenine methylase [Planctomycetota bacterium]
MIKYIGSKRVLIPELLRLIAGLKGVTSVVDLFSGTARVGHALKERGYRVHSNDVLAFAATFAMCYVETDLEDVEAEARSLIDEFNQLPGRPGYVHDTFAVASRYFRPENAARIDAIRAAIRAKSLEPRLEAVCLTALVEAADRVDSTTGVQMAYLKQLAPRAERDLLLRMPAVLPNQGQACSAQRREAIEVASELEADVYYLDPPYNQHSYLGNYHVWETIVLGDEPAHYGKACKRIDCRERKSAFNHKASAAAALAALLAKIRARYILVSFNDEGFLCEEQLLPMLRAHGRVDVARFSNTRYVGARIGIYNAAGTKVGRVGRLANEERIYVVECDADPLSCAIAAEADRPHHRTEAQLS